MRILYVEDEKILASAVIHLLKSAGIETDWADNGDDGLQLAQSHTYDCLVLDVMLPGLSGLDILETIRKSGNTTPVIMLSALNEVEDRIRGLDIGADDYLGKPFKTAELIARIRAIARRPREVAKSIITYADLSYDITARTLNGLQLTEKEGSVLELLMKTPEAIQNKSTILSHVWGYSVSADDNYVEVYISYLRRILKKLNSTVSIITVRNLGYKLVKNV